MYNPRRLGAGDKDVGMLPDFPQVKELRGNMLMRAAYARALQEHGILLQMRHLQIPEGRDFRAVAIGGDVETSGFHKIGFELSAKVEELPSMDDAAWLERLYEQITKPVVDEQEKLLIRRLDEVTAATGQVVTAKERPLHEVLLASIEMLPGHFDSRGEPVMPTLLVGKEMMEKFMTMETPDDFDERQREIIERKRIEWRLEQADRALVG